MENSTLEKISRFALRFLVPLTIQEGYAIIIDEALKLIKGEYGSIIMRENNQLKRVYTTAPIPYHSPVRQRAFAYRAFTQHTILVVPISKTVKAHPELKKLGIKYSVHIPLSYKNQSIGVLIINSKDEQVFSKQDLVILKLFGSMASLAIRKTQLHDETQKALEARDLFISMAAHEFRTPLTTITGYSQLLYSKLSGANTPESRWVSELSWETLRLTQLVNELLEVDRIRSGQFNYVFQHCSLKKVINKAMRDFHFTHPDYKVNLKDNLPDGKDIIVGDFDKLLQLIINLLDNAAKFSFPTTQIVIKLKAQTRFVYLAITDQGRGIPKKELPEIFQKFYKSPHHTKEGLGLGLFLAKNIVAQHHGKINIHSKEKKGTTVEIALPKARL